MSNLNFSKGKLSKFISSKGFYVAIAVCLVGAGTATWLAVDRTINSIENNNLQMIESENQWNEYPEIEAEKKQSGVLKQPQVNKSSPSVSSPSAQPSPSTPVSEPQDKSALSEVSEKSYVLSYVLPANGEITAPYSGGELVKNITLGDWRTHDGVDIAVEPGTDIVAAADGMVTSVRNDALWGTVVTIDHPDGVQTIYSGLDSTVPVKEGEQVIVGQVIGRLDAVPCELNEVSHLHYAMKVDGKWVDPMSTIKSIDN